MSRTEQVEQLLPNYMAALCCPVSVRNCRMTLLPVDELAEEEDSPLSK